MCVYTCVQVQAGRVLGSLKLELLVFVNCSMWQLGTECESSVRTLNLCAISLSTTALIQFRMLPFSPQ